MNRPKKIEYLGKGKKPTLLEHKMDRTELREKIWLITQTVRLGDLTEEDATNEILSIHDAEIDKLKLEMQLKRIKEVERTEKEGIKEAVRWMKSYLIKCLGVAEGYAEVDGVEQTAKMFDIPEDAVRESIEYMNSMPR